MRRLVGDCLLFLKEFRRTFHTTGAILPSSPALARGLARFVGDSGPDETAAGRRILEVGPGTGAVTRRIVQRMSAADQLDLVELNEQFVARLREQLQSEPALCVVADRTRLIPCAVQELEANTPYDLIISGLPLNNFAVDQVEEILDTFRRLLGSGGTLSFFEYIAVRKVRGALARSAEKTRLRGIDRTLSDLLSRHEIRREGIWLNVPPAWVHHVRF
jgi:phospholipid N-methyltransferase